MTEEEFTAWLGAYGQGTRTDIGRAMVSGARGASSQRVQSFVEYGEPGRDMPAFTPEELSPGEKMLTSALRSAWRAAGTSIIPLCSLRRQKLSWMSTTIRMHACLRARAIQGSCAVRQTRSSAAEKDRQKADEALVELQVRRDVALNHGSTFCDPWEHQRVLWSMDQPAAAENECYGCC